ncbi:globin-like protein [Eremomyces bilateralis CBS 781.70]|uniref:nitric oxide dioxygenase n=1 Tax=Eremomyces bilateralis CBS 781.70 TaxID=1392243 RepID=A0A6G1FR48_9PEZI|nr:globin-like protein [Eremomyces bilateralis CBS 781.70]KAF1808190.1 globin-like protein [Eremomyces bilateralis CBS 781.70]
MSLSPEQITIIKATVPVLAEHGKTVTSLFYKNVLNDNPALRNIFSHTHQESGHQAAALARSLYLYASHIEDLSALKDLVELVAHKHASLYVLPEHYPIVGKYLLAALKTTLGDACTPEILDAWGAAYQQLADILIGRESQLYNTTAGWTDWRSFRITKKVPESEQITSFYLEPVDKAHLPLPAHRPGQYIGLRTEVAELGVLQPRQYSLSDMHHPDHFRISVKKELALDPSQTDLRSHPGFVSNILHDEKKEGDEVMVSHPYGDFYLDADQEAAASPLVLLSAGVGLTPMVAILNALNSRSSTRPVSFIHGAHTSKIRAFGDHVQNTAKSMDNVNVVFFNSTVSEDDKQGEHYDHIGRADLKKLDEKKHLFLDDKSTHYFVCGPSSFMTDMDTALKQYGVDSERVHLERFGTGGIDRAV